MNKEELFKELKELNLLWSGLSRIPNFPKELLELSLNKLENINRLVKDLEETSYQPQVKPAFEKETHTREATPAPLAADLKSKPSVAEETKPIPAPQSSTPTPASSSPAQSSPLTTSVSPLSTRERSLPTQESSLPVKESGQTEEPVSPPVGKMPKLQTEKPESLVDRYEKTSSKESLQKKLESRHFADLSKALSLNDRFRFRRDLFGDSPETMEQVLQDINTMQSMDEALSYLHKNYSQHSETESFGDFCKLLNNHFSS
ncbi:MAG TPA: hypothetical protein PLW96_00950 [Bacteroidales bacterium]|nr:hypothetical protein [Bacteroidales bacterium]HOQ57454.1 hypothetical protein [Bacteroidales bacterium]HPL05799.1 hypothetical protein [Bacteroidales bacterium]